MYFYLFNHIKINYKNVFTSSLHSILNILNIKKTKSKGYLIKMDYMRLVNKKKNKYCKKNFFLWYNLYKKTNKNFYFLKKFVKKFTSFWPIFKKKKNVMNLFKNYIKKLKNNKYNVLKKKKSYNNVFLFGLTHIEKKKKSYYFRVHRRLMKIFWKSQEHFKINYLRKSRFTTRKFKNKFIFWYKKNKKTSFFCDMRLKDILVQSFFFVSVKFVEKTLASGLVHMSVEGTYTPDTTLTVNNIISLPLNFANFIIRQVVSKYRLLKYLKKKSFIFFKNKQSQWRDLKKKTTPELSYDLYSINKINTNLEFDVFSNNIVLIKKYKIPVFYTNSIIRHNLEKLNTYKLNV